MIEGSSLMLVEGAASTPLVVYFAADSDVIEPSGRATLDVLATFLDSHAALRLDVQGHADERGPDAYNEGLSLRRAQAVRGYLVDHGVAPERLSTTGFGEKRPVPTAAGASLSSHRRVEFAASTSSTPLSAANVTSP